MSSEAEGAKEWTIEWAAGQLGVSRRKMVDYVKDGLIGYVGLPPDGRHKRIYPEHIEAFKRAHSVGPASSRRGRHKV